MGRIYALHKMRWRAAKRAEFDRECCCGSDAKLSALEIVGFRRTSDKKCFILNPNIGSNMFSAVTTDGREPSE